MASFFLQLSRMLQEDNDARFMQIYEQCLHILKEQLSEDEFSLFLVVGRHLMSADLEYHKDREGQFLAELRDRILQARIKLIQNKKVVYACCLAGGVMLIVILL